MIRSKCVGTCKAVTASFAGTAPSHQPNVRLGEAGVSGKHEGFTNLHGGWLAAREFGGAGYGFDG